MTDNIFDLSTSIPSRAKAQPWARSAVPVIETCHVRAAHEHTEEERRELRNFGAQWGARSVNAYIELHEQPSARGRYTRIRHRRPPMQGLRSYAFTVAWAGPAKTNDDIHAERASAERQYEAEELRTAAELGITLAELRRRHWSAVSHLGEGGLHRLRRDLAWLRADVAAPRHRMDITSLFPNGGDLPLGDFRFVHPRPQQETHSSARTASSHYRRLPKRTGGAS